MLRLVNLIILVILVCVPIILSQKSTQFNDSYCSAKQTCSECIKIQSCAWCKKVDFKDNLRCFNASLEPLKCPVNDMDNPENKEYIISDAKLTKWKHGSVSSNIIQIYPQRVKLQLRANQKHSLKVSYSHVKDNAIDLYYLTDLRNPMEDKQKHFHLAELLASTLQNITSDFRLGFGTLFVNKGLMSNVSTNSLKPCSDCAGFYGYRNLLPLSSDTHRFVAEVSNAIDKSKECCNVLDNFDAPGDVFNALMQAVVCRNQIKWRVQARHLLIFATDAGFNFADDGKLSVITPNDGLCHLNSEGAYTHSTSEVYTSISQINLKVKQNAINLIFTVPSQDYGVFKNLSNHIEGSSCTILSDDLSNVTALVEDGYNKITSSVILKDSSGIHLEVSYFTACLGGGELRPKNDCDDVKVGDIVDFTVEILVRDCPQDPRYWRQQFQIYPVGIYEELTIDIEILCDCLCEKESIKKSRLCNYHGTYKCGLCECEPEFIGRQCECSLFAINSNGGCRATNDTLDCNGRGSCTICGICECERRVEPSEIISGKFCECDNFSCDRYNGDVCSANGECECGVCRCFNGWSGTACECPSSTDTCRRVGITDICSGHGDCVCGECRCHSDDMGRYSGRYCEKCPTCPSRCMELIDCVQCQMYGTGRLKGDICLVNCSNVFTLMEAEIIEVDEQQDENLCVFYDDNDCKCTFVYSEMDSNTLKVRVKTELDCPLVPNKILLVVIKAIVLIGLTIFLLWKILTIEDRREKDSNMPEGNAADDAIDI